LYPLSSLAGISGIIRWALVVLFMISDSLNVAHFQLDAIPTVGFSDPILSYVSAFQFIFGIRMLNIIPLSLYHLSSNLFDDAPILSLTQNQTRPGPFKIANSRRWTVLVARSEPINDIRKPPGGGLSTEPTSGVRYYANRRAYTNKNYPVRSIRIYARYIEHERLVPFGCNTFQIDSGNNASILNEVREELITVMDDLISTPKDITWQSPK
jgi:hypothetical protein